MPKWLGGAVVLLIVLYIVTQPAHAADMANGGWHLAQTAGHHLSTFVSHLGS